MCYVFVIYFLQPNNCKFAAKHVSAAKPAIQVLSKLDATAISVRCIDGIYPFSVTTQ